MQMGIWGINPEVRDPLKGKKHGNPKKLQPTWQVQKERPTSLQANSAPKRGYRVVKIPAHSKAN